MSLATTAWSRSFSRFPTEFAPETTFLSRARMKHHNGDPLGAGAFGARKNGHHQNGNGDGRSLAPVSEGHQPARDSHDAFIAVEIPAGSPQLSFHPASGGWILREWVLRCQLKQRDAVSLALTIDDRDFSPREFGKLLLPYARDGCWGLRIEIVPRNALIDDPGWRSVNQHGVERTSPFLFRFDPQSVGSNSLCAPFSFN